MVTNQFDRLKALHASTKSFIIFNCWDVASAKLFEESGEQVLATSSYSVAKTLGFADGEQLPFSHLLLLAKQLTENCTVPISVDCEGFYADSLEELAANAHALFSTGISGINFEDKKQGSSDYQLWSISEQQQRISCLKESATALGINIFINARTDVFFKEQNHSLKTVEKALERTTAYAAAGADCIFVPGLTEPDLIKAFAKEACLPVNIMVDETTAYNDWSSLGVKRISYGPNSFFQTMALLKETLRFPAQISSSN